MAAEGSTLGGKALEAEILTVFSGLAGSIGYSPIHGKIIGALLVEGKALSLQELAERTDYSPGMVSLSLDLLEVLGVVKRVKKTGDRKLYIKLEGDLLEVLKNAVAIKVRKGIEHSLADVSEKRKKVAAMKESEERERLAKTLDAFERELRRLSRYVSLLSGMKLP
jgi:DNA-binding transcriptional regulator GbsR (MarR family)